MTTLDTATRLLVNSLLGDRLPAEVARLYSQSTRVRHGQPSLQGWTAENTTHHFRNAVRLIELSLHDRKLGHVQWRVALLRAAEILEFLIPLEDNPLATSTRLAAAAAYQLAGYPARAVGMFASTARDAEGGVLSALLRGDFPNLQRLIVQYWERDLGSTPDSTADHALPKVFDPSTLDRMASDQQARALGIIAASFRWEEEPRHESAIATLRNVAAVLRSGHDPYLWMILRLAAESAEEAWRASLRRAVRPLADTASLPGQVAFERYCRQAFLARRAVAWPSQQLGLARLALRESFVLCTPTGSGKTTVAECGILSHLFAPHEALAHVGAAPLILYLVPSRALAAEVEQRLARVFRPIVDTPIVITGLYGGTDWGPSDAWLSSSDPTVLVCTPEKAEALLRYLGPFVLQRLTLLVLDEAHRIRFDGETAALVSGESRALRLEGLMGRLFASPHAEQLTVIGLSAVAGSLEEPLARWVTGSANAEPVRVSYRSTRQLIGKLEVDGNRRFRIVYDLLDREPLEFSGARSGQAPFINNPFPQLPAVEGMDGPEQRVRVAALWAALHFSGRGASNTSETVLISVAQNIDDYATTFLNLLNEQWNAQELMSRFRQPTQAPARAIWESAVEACRDYFGEQSNQYRLLQHGIVMHHGNMPGTIGRLLVELVEHRVVLIVLATSTLAEGVNLPVEVVLLPTLFRGQTPIPASDIANLAGRAGRPGFASEGRCLVILWQGYARASNRYRELLTSLATRRPTGATNASTGSMASALAALLVELKRLWMTIAGTDDNAAFLGWLEQTVPAGTLAQPAMDALDSLDGVLLPVIAELEDIDSGAIDMSVLEQRLTDVWRRCFASVAANEAAALQTLFVTRGKALPTVYPDRRERALIYRTGLSPAAGRTLLSVLPDATAHLLTGTAYATSSTQDRLAFIEKLIAIVRRHPKFSVEPPRRTTWESILHWWLAPELADIQPTPKQISKWYQYVSTAFVYRIGWGLGSITGTVLSANREAREPVSLDDWQATGLPWVGCWVKDLLGWGTLDPVASYLLSRQIATRRTAANELALRYYSDAGSGELTDSRDLLDPRRVRDWVQATFGGRTATSTGVDETSVRVELLREFTEQQATQEWKVLPLRSVSGTVWVDVGGFPLARSIEETVMFTTELDCVLNPNLGTVTLRRYL